MTEQEGQLQPGQGNLFTHHQDVAARLDHDFNLRWNGTPEDFVSKTQAWVQDAALHEQLSVTDEQNIRGAADILHMIQDVQAPAGTYDHVVILGGLAQSNDLRTGFAREQLLRPDVILAQKGIIHFWGGPRDPRENEHNGIINLKDIPVTQEDAALVRSAHLTEKAHETHQGALALRKHFGQLALSQAHIRLAEGRDDHLMSEYVFRAVNVSPSDQQMNQKVVLTNASFVARPQGAPRHTTESTARDALMGSHAPKDGDRLLFVTSNPYVHRTTENVKDVFSELNVDVQIEGCGPATAPHVLTTAIRGEIARRAYQDLRALRS